MTDEFDDRVLRAILGGLLLSNLTQGEMRRVSDALSKPQFRDKLKEAIRGKIGPAAAGLGKRPSNQLSAKDTLLDVEELLDFIQRKKLTKQQVRAFMSAVDPAHQNGPDEPTTIREMVSDFLASGSDRLSEFVKIAGRQAKSDPYLAGILNRSSR